MNADTKLPDWLATAMGPGGGIGATIWAASLAGVEISPWPLGPATTIPRERANSINRFSSWAPSAPDSRKPPEAMKAAPIPRSAADLKMSGQACG